MRLCRWLCVLAALAGPGLRPAAAQGAGETAFASRELDLWPSAVALGMTAATSRDPLTALWVNPAGIAWGPGQVGATHVEWFQDTRSEQLAVALGGSARLRLGVSAALQTTGDIPLRPLQNGIPVPLSDPTGFFEARDFTLGVSAAVRLGPRGSAGVTLRSLTQKVYTESASSFALDAGGQVQFGERLNAGAAVSNLGPALDWGSGATVPLPRALRIGATYATGPAVTVACDVWLIRDRSARLATGIEWQPVSALALRGGYLAFADAVSFTAGVGLAWRGIVFDYALVPLSGDLGTTHRAAVRVIPSRLRL